jgi:hypothetical protein
VKQPGVHKHGSDECQEIPGGIRKKATGNEGPLLNESVPATELSEEEEDVQSNQAIGDPWNRSSSGIVITDRKHHAPPFLATEAATRGFAPEAPPFGHSLQGQIAIDHDTDHSMGPSVSR